MTAHSDMLPLEFEPPPSRAAGPPAIRPRPYQTEALDKIERKHREGVNRQLAVLPTGTGKTVCFAHLIHRRRPGRALVLAHRDELIQQAVKKLAEVSGNALDIGIVKAKQNDTGAATVVASVQTLARPGRVEQLGRFGTVIVDEAHHSVADTYLDILARLGCMDPGGPLTVGWTATAQRTDKLRLGEVWQEITVQRGILQMIAEGYLVDVRGQQIGSDFNLGNLKVKAGDYTDGSIGDELERSDALAAVVRAYRQYADGRLAVGFTPTIATAHALAGEFTAAGIPAEAVDGTMPMEERRAVLARLHAGKTRVVANCFDAETEILTARGWAGMDTIRPDDTTATVSTITGEVEWQPISRIVRRHREPGERMVRITNQTLDVRVTEGHRMVTRAHGAKSWSVVEAGTLPYRQGPFELPLAGDGKYPGVPLTSTELEFLGLFATDGTLNRERASVEITQAAGSPMCAEIERILTGCGFDWKFHAYQGRTPAGELRPYCRYRIPKGTIGGQLARRGWGRLDAWLDKSLSPALADCTRDQFAHLICGMFIGDGLKHYVVTRPGNSPTICGADRVMFDRLQAWAAVRGYGTYLSELPNTGGGTLLYLRVRDRAAVCTNNHGVPTSGGNPARFEEEWCDEEVWCVTNANGTVITRRGGKVLVAGQCAVLTEGWDEPAVSCALMLRPTRSAPFFTQMVGRVLRPFTGRVAGARYEKTDALVLDVAGAADLGLATLATLAGLKPGAVKPGDSLMDAAEQLGDEERRKVAIGAIRTRQVDLLRRSERRWLDVDDSWVLPVGGGQVMILVPAGPDPLEDAWEVWRSEKGPPTRESAAALSLEWARGVGEEIARAENSELSRADAGWRKRPASNGQVIQLQKQRVEIPEGLTRGAASDLLTAKFAARDIRRIRKTAGR